MAVGIVVGLLAVGTFKLLHVCTYSRRQVLYITLILPQNEISPEHKTSHTLEKHEKKQEAKKAQ